MTQLIENTTKEQAEKVRMETINSMLGLNSHNTRHWSLSWPDTLSEQEVAQRVESAEVVIESFRMKVAQILGTKDSKIATVGFILTKPHLHCHLLLTASRSKINTSKETIKKIESLWLEAVGNSAKCTAAFNPSEWAEYMATSSNIIRKKQGWAPLPTHNPRLLDRKARHHKNQHGD